MKLPEDEDAGDSGVDTVQLKLLNVAEYPHEELECFESQFKKIYMTTSLMKNIWLGCSSTILIQSTRFM